MPANIIGCRPQSYCDFADGAFAHMAKVGIKNVEMSVPPKDKWAERAAELKKYGLTCTSVAGGVDLSKPEQIAAFENLAQGAKEFGAKIIFLSVKTGGRPLPECYQEVRKLGDIAKAHGATIGLETHPDMVTNGDIAIETMKNVNHPNVKLNYDSANLYYYNENVDGIAELKKFLPHLIAVHLKETNGKLKSWYFPGLHEGEGIVNFPEIFKVCNAAGFYGPFTMEIEGIQGEKLTREIAEARIANSMKYLKSIGAI